MTFDDYAKALIFSGAILFFIGLLQGALIPYTRNPRMALSAHLTAVQCGMTLMIFGLIRPLLGLNELSMQIVLWTSIAGFYLLWFGIALSAISGASKALPIAGKGYSASPLQESAVYVIMGSGSLLSFISGGTIIAGLWNTLT